MKPIMTLHGNSDQDFSKSLKALMQQKSVKEKEKILRYLKDGKIVATAAGRAHDLLTGEEIPGEFLLYSDGIFEWSSAAIYYFEKYNVKLADDFIAHVLKKA